VPERILQIKENDIREKGNGVSLKEFQFNVSGWTSKQTEWSVIVKEWVVKKKESVV
jgi:hypothetical protein